MANTYLEDSRNYLGAWISGKFNMDKVAVDQVLDLIINTREAVDAFDTYSGYRRVTESDDLEITIPASDDPGEASTTPGIKLNHSGYLDLFAVPERLRDLLNDGLRWNHSRSVHLGYENTANSISSERHALAIFLAALHPMLSDEQISALPLMTGYGFGFPRINDVKELIPCVQFFANVKSAKSPAHSQLKIPTKLNIIERMNDNFQRIVGNGTSPVMALLITRKVELGTLRGTNPLNNNYADEDWGYAWDYMQAADRPRELTTLATSYNISRWCVDSFLSAGFALGDVLQWVERGITDPQAALAMRAVPGSWAASWVAD